MLDTKYPLEEYCCNITSLKVTNSSKPPDGDSKRNISYYNFEFDWPITCNISYGSNITGNLSYPEWWVRTGNVIGSHSSGNWFPNNDSLLVDLDLCDEERMRWTDCTYNFVK